MADEEQKNLDEQSEKRVNVDFLELKKLRSMMEDPPIPTLRTPEDKFFDKFPLRTMPPDSID